MKRRIGKTFCLALLLTISILSFSCGNKPISADHPTITPTQPSILFAHLKNPDFRGTIIDVFKTEGMIHAIQVEGIWKTDTFISQASVKITEKTRIYSQKDNGYEIATLDGLFVGKKVEIIFIGAVLERYPPIVEADEIMIIP